MSIRELSGRMAGIFILMLLFFAASMIAQGQEEPDEMKTINRITELEAELNADDFAQRERAETELIALGPTALDYLSSIDSKMSTDTQVRLQRVRVELEKQAIERVSQPSRITLDGKTSIGDVLTEILKQTGNKVVLVGSVQINKPEELIDTGWNNAEFWTVMRDVQERGGVLLDPYVSQPDQLALSEVVAGGPAMAVLPCEGAASVLSFALQRIDATRNFANPQTSGMSAEIRLRWEPRLRPIKLSLPMSSLKVIDEFGKEHSAVVPEEVLGTMLQPEIPQSEMTIPLPLFDRQIESIQSIKGVFEMTVPGRIETFEFPNIAKMASGTNQTRGGATVAFEGIGENLDLKELRISLSFVEPNEGMESHLGWATENEVFLKKPDGERLSPIGLETWQRDDFLLGVTYLFPEIPDDAILVYRSPAAIVQLKVAFELLGIPLP